MLIGGAFGAVAARRVKMTAMPQMVALFNGVGGGAAALIALAEFHRILARAWRRRRSTSRSRSCLGADRRDLVLRLDGRVREAAGADRRPADHVPGPAGRQRRSSCWSRPARSRSSRRRRSEWLLWALVGAALLFGVLFVLPIGGADMPVVISLLNSFTGLAVAAGGFVLENNVLIMAGTLVGASGTLLTLMMGKAMNRSLANVLFGAFGQVSESAAAVAAADRRRLGALGHRRGRGGDARLRAQGHHRAGLRHGGGAGPARRARARRPARGEGRRGQVRDPSGRRPHARPHERAARRGQRAVPAAEGDGRDQPRVRADRRRARDRRERRREPGRAQQPGSPIYGMPILDVDKAQTSSCSSAA